jgi:glycosyltransferase involved in cell wall biosynthesis
LSSIRPPDTLIAQSERIDRWANSFQRKIPFESMPLFYHGIDFYLNTSWHEGTPNPALEAASCGVPVISTRVGNMPDLIVEGENGFFIDPTAESVQDLFERILKVSITDYDRMCDSMQRAIQNEWTWDKQITNYREAFNRFLN